MPCLRLLSTGEGISSDVPRVINIDKPVMVIGRSAKSDVQLNSANAINTISRRHAEIHSKADGVVIRDAGSVNGVFVNRVKVQEASLKHGDEVQLGGAAGLALGATLAADTPTSSIVYKFEGDDEPPARPSTSSSSKTTAALASVSSSSKRKAREEDKEAADANGSVAKKKAAAAEPKKKAAEPKRQQEGEGLGAASPPIRSGAEPGRAAAPRRQQQPEEERRDGEMDAIRKVLEVAPGIDVLPTVRRLLEVKRKAAEADKACEGLAAQLKKVEGERDRLQAKLKEAQAQLREKAEAEEEERKKVQDEMRAAQDKVQEVQKALEEKVKLHERQVKEKKAETDAVLQKKDEEMAELRSDSSKSQAEAEARVARAVKKEVEKHAAELQAAKAKLEEQAAEQLETEARLKKELKELKSQIKRRDKESQSGAAELVHSLRGELGCAICSDLILDAGILPCSHGFCYKCIHGKLEQKRMCPLCDSEGGALPGHVRPRRSTHLDTIVHMVTDQALTPAEREKWEARLVKQGEFWRSIGGEEVGYQVEEEAGNGKERRKKGAGKAARSEKVVCEGCNEEGHAHAECPHRDEGYGDEDDEEEDDDEESDQEDDEEEEGGRVRV